MSFVVAQRTKELSIRMAIGAQATNVLNLVLGQGASLVLIGTAVGLVLSFFASRYVEQILFGVSPFDLLTFAAVPTLLLAVALFACAFPAWRASRIDPLIALRQEKNRGRDWVGKPDETEWPDMLRHEPSGAIRLTAKEGSSRNPATSMHTLPPPRSSGGCKSRPKVAAA
jgi:hypothetical protein